MRIILNSIYILIITAFQIYAQINPDSTLLFHIDDTADVRKDVNPKEIIENYITALGGRENLSLVEDKTIEMSGQVLGFDIKLVTYQKYPNLLRQEIEAGEASQIIIYDGEEGIIKLGDSIREISDVELDKLKYESYLRLLLNLDSLGITLNYIDMDSSDGNLSHKIEFVLPSGQKWIQYYNVKDSLKIKEEKDVVTPQGTFNQETFYKDFRVVNGVKYPYEIIQNIGAQDMIFKVDLLKVNTGLSEEKFQIDE